MATEGISIRDAVRDCINTDLNSILIAEGLDKYKVGGDAIQGKWETFATSVYKPNYDACMQNDLRIYVAVKGREFLFDESLQNSRDRSYKQISSNYTVNVELFKKLHGKDDEDAYPIAITDELESVFELMENLLFCKRQYDIDGQKFFQDAAPLESGYEEGYFDEDGIFAKQIQVFFRSNRCCL